MQHNKYDNCVPEPAKFFSICLPRIDTATCSLIFDNLDIVIKIKFFTIYLYRMVYVIMI